MTRRRSGGSLNFSAPVEVTIFSSSISMPGRFAETEPEAMTIDLVSMVCGAPLSGVTVTLPAPAIEPVPRKEVILFFLNRKSTPLTLAVDRVVLVLQHARQVELRRRDVDAEIGEMGAGLLEQLRGVQQGLRRDAADVEAGAAEGRPFLDHGDLHPELGGADGADVAARAGTDDREIECIRHESLWPRRA